MSAPARPVIADPASTVPPGAERVAPRGAVAAAVGAGAVVGYLASTGYWYLALGLLLVIPGFVLLHRYPLAAVSVWLLGSPWVNATDGAAARRIYWVVHRWLPVAALAALVFSTVLGLRTRRLPRLGWPEVLMAGYLVASLLSVGYTSPTPRATTYLLYDAVFVPMCLYLLVRLAVPDGRDLLLLVPAVVALVVGQSVVGLLSWSGPEALPPEWLAKAGERTVGSLRSADVFGATLLFGGIFVLHAGLAGSRRLAARVAAVLVFLLALVMVFLTFSRAAWLAGLVAVAGLLVVYRRQVGQIAVVVLPLVLLLAASGALTQQLVFAQERLESTQSEESALSRLPVAVAAIRMFEDRPVAGWGYQNFELVARPFQGRVGDVVGASKSHASHNLFLTTLAEQGLVGFVLLSGPLVIWLARTGATWRRLPRSGMVGRQLVAALWLVVAAFVIVNNFARMQLPFAFGLWWLALGLIATVVARHSPTRPARPAPPHRDRRVATRRDPPPAALERSPGAIVYVTGTYPLLTTTFIDREIRVLRRRGVDVRIVAMRRPEPGTPLSEDQRDLAGGVTYVTPVRPTRLVAGQVRALLTHPLTYAGTLVYLVTRPHPGLRARAKTILHVGEGVHVAHLVRGTDVRELYAQFADRAATVALVASRLLRRPYSMSIHAGADVFVRPVLLREKIAGARHVVTCTAQNRAHIAALVGEGLARRIAVVPHGLDLSRYRPRPWSAAGAPPVVVAVGQLVERKGFAQLVAACRDLRDRGQRFRCRIVGDGPDRSRLERLVAEASLDDTVTLRGALSHDQVIEECQRAALVVLPCVRTRDGDVDGLPNVLAEAMALERPVVSSDLPAIRELVTDGSDGILVPAGDIGRLAEAIGRLLDDPALGQELGAAGRRTVARRFDVEANVRLLAATLWPDLASRETWA